MPERTPFEFLDNDKAIEAGSQDSSYVARLPLGLMTTSDLLAAIATQLRVPEYFGFNWNALSDCLRDFHWLQQHTVVLVHQDLPKVSDSELLIYLELLVDAVQSWQPGEVHALRVVFPEHSRTNVLRLIARAN